MPAFLLDGGPPTAEASAYPNDSARLLQLEVRKDLRDDRLLQDRRGDLQLAAKARAVIEVELKRTLEQPCPTQQ